MNEQERLKKLFNECIDELKTININVEKSRKTKTEIEIKINKRSKKRYGCCKKISKDGFQIEVSQWVMDLNENIIKNTIMHELIHCLPRCNNHGEVFKNYAKTINEKLGYNITRVGNKEKDFNKSNLEFKEKEIKYNYKIVCEKCNQTFLRQRVSKGFTRKYRCGKCGGAFKIIDL
jgi:hypothetical protein